MARADRHRPAVPGRPPGSGFPPHRRPGQDRAPEPAPGFGFRLHVWPDAGPDASQRLSQWVGRWAHTLGLQHTGGPSRGRIAPGEREPALVDVLDFVASAIDRPGVRLVVVGRPDGSTCVAGAAGPDAEVLSVSSTDLLARAALDLYRHGRVDAVGCVAALGGYVLPGTHAPGWRLL